ncbi:unnamed protein product [Ambrosiozyma monospora]|uniref:Unnamed protein product n=1 Tax=Ambrosiozyma monospora TaxID=43982 RepID=A0ACB5TD85_AMBMO|nr:unnamed protein product [Ambrosiozyma monospora]
MSISITSPTAPLYSQQVSTSTSTSTSSDTQIQNLINDLYNSELTYLSDLHSLHSLIYQFDYKYDSYYDDSNDDISDQLIHQRKQQNTQMLTIIDKLIKLHDSLQSILVPGSQHSHPQCQSQLQQLLFDFDFDLVQVKLSKWLIFTVRHYAQYVDLYRLNFSQSSTEVRLRRKPLIRIRYLLKFTQKWKQLLNFQTTTTQYTSDLLSNLEIASHKLSKILNDARAQDEEQRSKISKHLHFNSCKSIETFQNVACCSFDLSWVSAVFDSQLFYKNDELDCLLNLSNVQIMFLRNEKFGDLQSMALLKVEDAGKSLIFPPLKSGELKFINEVNDDTPVPSHTTMSTTTTPATTPTLTSSTEQFFKVLVFKHSQNNKIEIYLKYNPSKHSALQLKQKLLSLFPSTPLISSDPNYTTLIKQHHKYNRTTTLGAGIDIPDDSPAPPNPQPTTANQNPTPPNYCCCHG